MNEHNNQQSLYDSKYQAEEWSLIKVNPDGISTNSYDDTARLLRGEAGSLLEIGCGSGKFTMAIAEQFDRVVGFDISKVRIELANKMLTKHCSHMSSKIKFLTEDADRPLPFKDDEFNVVVLCAVIEHVVDLFHIMDEAYRVCKPGGAVIIAVPNLAYIKHVVGLLFGKHPLTGINTRKIEDWRHHGWDGAHLHYFTKSSLADLLVNVGFVPEIWTGDGHYGKFRRWCTNLVGGLTVKARKL